MFNEYREKTVPCKICRTPTEMTGTELCDGCWEVIHRLEVFLKTPKGLHYILTQAAKIKPKISPQSITLPNLIVSSIQACCISILANMNTDVPDTIVQRLDEVYKQLLLISDHFAWGPTSTKRKE